MPCTLRIPAGLTPKQWAKRWEGAVNALEQDLSDNRAIVKIGPDGAIAFSGWTSRDGVSDVCAYRWLAGKRSFALQKAVMRAEALAGKKVNERAIAAGSHSHDGGATWSKD